jgi:GNAT superfamily N-acetyltransferase
VGVLGDRRDPLIRLAKQHEARDLAELVNRAYTVYVERIGRRPAPMDDDYQARIRDGEVFVAEEGGDAVGLIVLALRPGHLLIDTVAVDPVRQGTGIGRALLEHAELHARDLGLDELRLYTNAAMTENLELYPHLGYTETGRRLDRGFERVFFCKQLSASETSGFHRRSREDEKL